MRRSARVGHEPEIEVIAVAQDLDLRVVPVARPHGEHVTVDQPVRPVVVPDDLLPRAVQTFQVGERERVDTRLKLGDAAWAIRESCDRSIQEPTHLLDPPLGVQGEQALHKVVELTHRYRIPGAATRATRM